MDVKSLTPEQRRALVSKLASSLPVADVLAATAHSDSVEGYCAFYELLHGFKPPEHIVRDVEKILGAHAEGIGSLIFNYRGAWKSVSISVTFLAWRIGLHPEHTNMVVGANDDSAEKVTKAIAALIEFHPEWMRVFPYVRPDTGRWSVEGFSVVDTRMSREEWAQKQAGIIDPTLIGGGYKSSRLIGKHPSGCLILDDIHDLGNSASRLERQEVVQIVTKVLLKTVLVENDKMTTFLIAVGTPWAEDDAYNELRKTGQYEFISIPVMTRADVGEGVYIDGKNRDGIVFEDIVGWWHLTHPERFGVNQVIKSRSEGKAAFWQMFMLDLTTAAGGGLKYYCVPRDNLRKDWPMQGGADPAFTMKDRLENVTKNSAFAMAFVARRPQGGAAVMDGVLEKCSLQQAAGHILNAETSYPSWTNTAVENVGMGVLFKEAIRLINPALRLIPSDLGGIRMKGEKAAKAKSKHDRILYELAPWLEKAVIVLSDADTKYLNALRSGLDNFYELDDRVADERWDALDALYHAVKAMPDVLQTPAGDNVLPSIMQKKHENPLANIGAYRGYEAR